jgi:hypothetical protein
MEDKVNVENGKDSDRAASAWSNWEVNLAPARPGGASSDRFPS